MPSTSSFLKTGFNRLVKRYGFRRVNALFRHTGATIGGIVLLFLLISAGLAPWITTYDPTTQNYNELTIPPGFKHIMGTDSLGRDVLSRVLFGARISISFGLISTGVGLLFGLPLGLAAGYLGGIWDRVFSRIIDAVLSFPPILLAMAIVGSLGPDIQNAMLALGIVFAPVFARLIRAETLVIKEEEFVLAARALGTPNLRMLTHNILPNVAGPLIVQATFTFSQAIIAEAALSFLGLGVQPPTPSWGLMLEDGRRYLQDASWLILAPGGALSLTVLAVNFLGDGLRDLLDPKTYLRG